MLTGMMFGLPVSVGCAERQKVRRIEHRDRPDRAVGEGAGADRFRIQARYKCRC